MKITLKIISIFYLMNGILMLVLPEIWYRLTPGVEHSGAINVHFIRDIGLGFCAASAWALLVRHKYFAPLIFIGGHGILHMFEFFDGHFAFNEILRDVALIILPAIIFCVLLINQKGDENV